MTVVIHLLSQNHLNWAIPRVLLQLLYISIWSIWHHMEKILFALQLLASQTPWICIIQCFKLRLNLEPEHGGRHGCQMQLEHCWQPWGRAVPGQDGTTTTPGKCQLCSFPPLVPQENDHPQMSNAPERNLTGPRAKQSPRVTQAGESLTAEGTNSLIACWEMSQHCSQTEGEGTHPEAQQSYQTPPSQGPGFYKRAN